MTTTDAVILGLVQGLTEFLPVSSSGHLVVAQKLLGLSEHDLAFDIAAHLGTLFAIITVYFGLARRMVSSIWIAGFWRGDTEEGKLLRLTFWASVPTAIIGLLFKDVFERMFSDYQSLGYCFMISGVLLLLTKLRGGGRVSAQRLDSLEGINGIQWWQAALIGVAQALAIAPSISRSGSTIVAALLLGIPGGIAATFSFIISLPAVAGAAVLELKDVAWSSSDAGRLLIGAISAYLSGVAGLYGIIGTVRRGRLDIFSVYMFFVGAFVLWAWG